MLEVIFLIALGLIWIFFASMQDLKNREVANWLSFSLIIFALGFRFFWSLFSENARGFMFFYQGLIGVAIFFILGNLLYYSRIFAGGDAKLMIALGAILPFSKSFYSNLEIFVIWIFLFLFAGLIYGLVWCLFLSVRNFKNLKKEARRQFLKNKIFFYLVMAFGVFLIILGFLDNMFFILGTFIFLIPYFFVYAKSIDEVCMIRKIKVKNLTEGDWLYKDVKIGKKTIVARWDGLSLRDIELLRKNKKDILIRQGIPFVPVFLIAFLVLTYIYFALGIDFIMRFI